MVPLTLFHSRSFSGANLLTLFLYSALGIFFFLFPLNLIQVQGYSTTGDRRGCASVHTSDVFTFAMVRRLGRALRRAIAADRRAADRRDRLRDVRGAGSGSELLESIFPGVRSSRFRDWQLASLRSLPS